jgi:hypothetical protein
MKKVIFRLGFGSDPVAIDDDAEVAQIICFRF